MRNASDATNIGYLSNAYVNIFMWISTAGARHTPLNYTALHYTTPHHTHHTTPHHTAPHHTTPHHTTRHDTTRHDTTQHYTTLHFTTLHYTTLTDHRNTPIKCLKLKWDHETQACAASGLTIKF